MSLYLIPMSLGSMSHVDFKKWPCRSVGFQGEGPHQPVTDNTCTVCVKDGDMGYRGRVRY